MILSKEQINRYLRHIIMPEISGPGQKKLLDAQVAVYSESPEVGSPLLYYLACSGIGHIHCVFKDETGCELLLNNLRDLNSDILITNNKLADKLPFDSLNQQIVIGGAEYAANNLAHLDRSIPVIIAVDGGWNGYLQVFRPPIKIEESITPRLQQWKNNDDKIGEIFSACLLGAVTALETIKLILDIGTPAVKPFCFDLLSMSFDNGANININSVPCNLRSDAGGQKLADCRALIIGTGGLGSPAAYALARAGIGTLGLVDHDTVDISNLNRQILHSGSRVGLPKVDSAEVFLRQLNPDITINKYHTSFNRENAFEIISNYDVVIDGVDNFPTRYLINDACYFAKKPMIEAGVLRFDGMGMTIIPDQGMCYRCLFPTIPAPGSIPSCSETGILGPVPGVMGFVEACEAVKLLTSRGSILKDSLLAFDALDLTFEILQTGKSTSCPLCGPNPSIDKLEGYEFVCEN